MNPDRLQRMAEAGYIVLILTVAAGGLRAVGCRRRPTIRSARAFPRWVSYGLGALGLAMIVRRILGASLGRASQSMVTGLDGEADHVLSPGRRFPCWC